MTTFEDNNLPEQEEMAMVRAVPSELFPDVHAAFAEALTNGAFNAHEAKVAYVYDRKGYISLDTMGGHRNKSYGSDTDDIIIQLTVRVANPKRMRVTMPALKTLEAKVIESKRQEEIAKLEAELEVEDARAREAAAVAKEKREKLNALRAG